MLTYINSLFTQTLVGVIVSGLIAACIFELLKLIVRRLPSWRAGLLPRSLTHVEWVLDAHQKRVVAVDLFAFLLAVMIVTFLLLMLLVIYVGSFVATFEEDVFQLAKTPEDYASMMLIMRYSIQVVYMLSIVTLIQLLQAARRYINVLRHPRRTMGRLRARIAAATDAIPNDRRAEFAERLQAIATLYQSCGLLSADTHEHVA